MKLTVFQSEKGDCLLVTSEDSTRQVLADGGMRASYQKFVAPALGVLAEAGAKLDLVYVSHIDQDHIAGVLQLMDDKAAWKVHDFQLQNDNPSHPEPRVKRPPDVSEVWHNAFSDQVDAAGEVADLLAASAAILSGAEGPDKEDWLEIAQEQLEIATSIPEAIRLSRRLSSDQLDIPLNKRFGKKLAFVRTEDAPSTLKIGPLRVSVIGPFEEDLTRLRKDWKKWLRDNEEQVEELRRKAEEEAERMGGANDTTTLLNLLLTQSQRLGDRKKVTPPNLASLMLLVSEGGKTLLLTGDGHATDILRGLAYHKKLDDGGRVHVNVLKVQHHGSEHNFTEEFASRVTAEHYVFCGNGEHENPDLEVLEVLLQSRLDGVSFRATHPAATGPFQLWFNSSETATRKPAAREHMKAVRELVENRIAGSGGRLTARFLDGDTASFELTI